MKCTAVDKASGRFLYDYVIVKVWDPNGRFTDSSFRRYNLVKQITRTY